VVKSAIIFAGMEERKLLQLMERLITALDGLQTDPTLRQMWLEVQWIKNNLKDGQLVLPTDWQLMIFKPPASLRKHERVATAASELAHALRQYTVRKLEQSD